MKQTILGVLALMLVAMAPALADGYVTVGGWQFTLNDPGWTVRSWGGVEHYNLDSPGYDLGCGDPQLAWSDFAYCGLPFFYQAYPEAAPDDEEYHLLAAGVTDIIVAAIPVDVGGMGTKEILADAIELTGSCLTGLQETNTSFAGRTAYLQTWEGKLTTTATLAVLLDNQTVAVIRAMTESGYSGE